MKKIAVAIALSLSFLTACNSGEPAPTETVTVEASPRSTPDRATAPYPVSNAESQFLDAVASEMTPNLYDTPQEDVVNLGYVICDALDRGASVDDILTAATDNGVNPYDAGLIIGAATVFFCPEHEAEVADWATSTTNA